MQYRFYSFIIYTCILFAVLSSAIAIGMFKLWHLLSTLLKKPKENSYKLSSQELSSSDVQLQNI